MTGSAARGRWTCRDWRSRRCRCAVCCASRWHSRLGSSRSKSNCRRPNGTRGRNAGALCRTRRNEPRRDGLAGDSRRQRKCRRSMSGRLRCRRRRCGSRWACCGFGLRRLCFSFLLRFGGRFCRGESQEMLPDELSVVQVERARVRLLVRDADLWQVIDQDLGLDLEFSGQLIDADLIWI
jgi:hypothetical protein